MNKVTRQPIKIPATLVIGIYLRLYVIHTLTEKGDDDFPFRLMYFDVPWKRLNNSREEMLDRLSKLHGGTPDETSYPQFGSVPGPFYRHEGCIVWGVQIVETTTIRDGRAAFGHEKKVTVATKRKLTPLHIIFGKKVDEDGDTPLLLETQPKKPIPDNKEAILFGAVGRVPFNPKEMIFAPVSWT